jgi:NAD(P)-dependent dehydrogenase (short-subunit alcohol dehydrogenase family)
MTTAFFPLTGRHALVTGAGRGIGATIAARLSAAGAAVTLLGRDLSVLQQAASALTGPHHVGACDVTQADSVAHAFEQARAALGPIDVLVNNAGLALSAPFAKTSLAQGRPCWT